MDDNLKPKMTFRQWIENVWYHYKVPIILGLVVILMVSVGLYQSLSKKEPDVFFYYVGQSSITVKKTDDFKSDMENIMEKDYNGDGKKVVDYKEDIFVMYSVEEGANTNSYVYNSTDQMNIVQRFNMELGMGECVIYIMEPNLYKANKQYIRPLEESLDKVPTYALDDKGIKLSDLPAYQKTAMRNFPSDYVICVRAKRNGDKEAFYNANVDFFRTLTEYK